MSKIGVISIAFVILVVIGAIFLFVPRETQEEQVVESVATNEQEIIDNKVLVSEVVSSGPGWIVIHADDEGKPGQILGYSPVGKGSNTNVVVDIDSYAATQRLFAMLHTDRGIIGNFEFPGVDAPERHEDDTIVLVAFNIETTQTEEIPEEPLVSIKEFTIEGDDSALYPPSIEVNKGDTVKITFFVRSQGTYFGGLDFRSDVWGDTGKVSKGESTLVEFVATETFQYKSYWPASNKLKATGTINVV